LGKTKCSIFAKTSTIRKSLFSEIERPSEADSSAPTGGNENSSELAEGHSANAPGKHRFRWKKLQLKSSPSEAVPISADCKDEASPQPCAEAALDETSVAADDTSTQDAPPVAKKTEAASDVFQQC
jgi:hypothetical protein